MGRLLVSGPSGASGSAEARHHLWDHTVEGCSGRFEAMRVLGTRAIDVVVTDPATSATEDLALIKELYQARPGIKAIVLAPALTSADVIAALRNHVYACFTRPIDYEEVAGMARAAIEDADWRDGIEVTVGVAGTGCAARVLPPDYGGSAHPVHDRYSGNIPSADRDLLMTAFREMLLNAMEHGAGLDPEKVIEVIALRPLAPSSSTSAIRHRLRLHGTHPRRAVTGAADVMKTASNAPPAGRRPGGFGMLIARQIVDQLVYNEQGNVELLIKHLK